MKSSQSIRNEISAVPADLRLVHTRAQSAKLVIKQLSQSAWNDLALHRGGESDNPSNEAGRVLAFCRSEAGASLAAASAVLQVLEGSPEFKQASAKLDPLHKELGEAIEAEATAAHERQLAEQAVKAAEEDARAKLTKKIDQDPKVKKAKEALAGIRRLGEPLLSDEPARELAADFP